MEKFNGENQNIQIDNIVKLKGLFPELFSDGKLDVEKLKQLFNENYIAEQERYRLEWAGKHQVFEEIAKRSTTTLTPDKDRSIDFENSKNVFIEGENLEVLRTLQKAYHSKVKMIYIDPPYNTGKDFVYNDNFRNTIEEYEEKSGNTDEQGNLAKAYTINSRDSGQYHSNWLNMMYPRLYLARNLLRDDGVIFVSIDDNEVHNLRMVLNEIFGEENFIAEITWMRKRGRDNSAKFFSRNHEYLLCYSKNNANTHIGRIDLSQETLKAYSNPDKDTRGDYRLLGVWARGSQGGSRYLYTAKTGESFEERLWLVNKETMQKMDEENRLVVKGDKIYRKLFLSENKGTIPATIWDDVSNAANAADEIKKLFDNKQIFDTVKPLPYLLRMLKISTEKNDIILDFFAGSATTAHAVMKLNAEDGGNRRYICVQIPEKTPVDSLAHKSGYNTISEIAIERIKRSVEKIKKEHPKYDGDLGVKTFVHTESHFPTWRAQSFKDDKMLQSTLQDFSNKKAFGESYERVMELLLKLGYELTTPIKKQNGYFTAANGEIALVVDEKKNINLDEIIKERPGVAIVFENVFQTDDEKINFSLICKSHNIIFQTV